jgi:hypothetical protein
LGHLGTALEAQNEKAYRDCEHDGEDQLHDKGSSQQRTCLLAEEACVRSLPRVALGGTPRRMKTMLLMMCVVALAACKGSNPPPPEVSAASTGAPAASTAAPTPSAEPAATASAAAPGASPAAVAPPATTTPGVWNFDSDKAEAPPAGFSFGRTGQGKEGRWVVVAAPDAPSKPNVVAQMDADSTDYRFPVAVVDSASFKDVKLSVSCKPISGKVDQGCGLVWRYKDANNYMLTRANALEDNVRLYYVKDGKRVQVASWSGKVATNKWHKLQVEAKGDHVVVTFDEKKILDAKDTTFTDAGKVGLWTKADSVIQFDDLAASAL